MPDSIHNHHIVDEAPSTLPSSIDMGTSEVWGDAATAVQEASKIRTQPRQTYVTVADTLASDTTSVADVRYALLIEKESAPGPKRIDRAGTEGDILSWVISVLVVLFLAVSLRFRRSFRFMHSMMQSLTSSRTRKNMFDDTAGETMLLILLDILCIFSISIMLPAAVAKYSADISHNIPSRDALLASSLTAAAIVGAFYLWQIIAYFFIGRTFITPQGTSLWIRGFCAGQGLLSLIMLPLALISVFYPASLGTVLIIASFAYILARFIFISKGFKIFSPQSNSFLPFLYYLCTVEIVPLAIIWRAACKLF